MFLLVVFSDCAVLPRGFGEEDLTAGQRRSDFLQPFCMEKPQRALELLKVIGETHLRAQWW